MHRIYKLNILVFIAIMFLPCTAFGNMLTDITYSPNQTAIQYLSDNNIITGYSDGTFRPSDTINRAELLKILVGAKGITPTVTQYHDCFPDVNTQWFSPYVCYAKVNGWVQGYPDNTFRPSNTVNKVEAIKMLVNSQGYSVPLSVSGTLYADVQKDQWYAPYIQTAKDKGLLEKSIGVYGVMDGMTRGEISENIYRAIIFQKNDVPSYRQVSEDEIKNITPANYAVVKEGAYPANSLIIPIKINNEMYTAIFFESESYSEINPPKVAFIRMDPSSGAYVLAADIFDFTDPSIEHGFQLLDINADGNQEIAISGTTACGSTCTYDEHLITLKDNKVVDLGSSLPESNWGYRAYPEKNTIEKIDYIFEENEGHWACHYWSMEVYGWNGLIFSIIERKTSGQMFALDAGDAMGKCEVVTEAGLRQSFGYEREINKLDADKVINYFSASPYFMDYFNPGNDYGFSYHTNNLIGSCTINGHSIIIEIIGNSLSDPSSVSINVSQTGQPNEAYEYLKDFASVTDPDLLINNEQLLKDMINEVTIKRPVQKKLNGRMVTLSFFTTSSNYTKLSISRD